MKNLIHLIVYAVSPETQFLEGRNYFQQEHVIDLCVTIASLIENKQASDCWRHNQQSLSSVRIVLCNVFTFAERCFAIAASTWKDWADRVLWSISNVHTQRWVHLVWRECANIDNKSALSCHKGGTRLMRCAFSQLRVDGNVYAIDLRRFSCRTNEICKNHPFPIFRSGRK